MGSFYKKTTRFSGEITKKLAIFFYDKISLRNGGENIKEIEKILGLENYKILNILERNDKNKIIKIIEIETKNKKQKCPICGEYTTSIHDRLKPIELKYLKLFEYDTKIIITKKRFICHKCNKKFTM